MLGRAAKYEVKKAACVRLYREHGRLKSVANELECSIYSVALALKKAGEPIIWDRLRHGSDRVQFATKVENIFRRLVPSAICNEDSVFNSPVDFRSNGLEIEVKAARSKNKPHCRGLYWIFDVSRQRYKADAFALFGYHKEFSRLYLIPSSKLTTRSVQIPIFGHSKWKQFEVSHGSLAESIENLKN
jgi:hypothetical protein